MVKKAKDSDPDGIGAHKYYMESFNTHIGTSNRHIAHVIKEKRSRNSPVVADLTSVDEGLNLFQNK